MDEWTNKWIDEWTNEWAKGTKNDWKETYLFKMDYNPINEQTKDKKEK